MSQEANQEESREPETYAWDQVPSIHDTEREKREAPMSTLAEVAERVRSCTDCPLHRDRTNAVPGEGPEDARIMLIAEGPGANEDQQGMPFVGQAGYFLDDLLAAAGINRSDVFITNMIKCRAPQNRDPEPSEMETCSRYLDRQIEIIDPAVIVTLGRFSMAKFLPGETISRARGRLRRREGRNIFPIMHPAAGLRRKDNKATVIQDFLSLPEIVRQALLDPPEEEPQTEPQKEKGPDPQGTLF